MTYIKSNEWKPSPKILMDEKTLGIVKSKTSMSILAGPGTGKTELLAQRASFLLTTGLCPPPQRILAIAFKVDAARNLNDRVASRCDPTQSQRFDSLTLDAFSKKIIDQFRDALPEQWRPSHDYKIIFPNRDVWEEFRLNNLDEIPEIRIKNDKQLNKIVHMGIPNFEPNEITILDQKIQWLWWRQQIESNPSRLTFDMIKSLATLIFRSQHIILSALQHTYPHVFLDEFQDVTERQYELIQTAFLKSNSILTAVGDSKQAIMQWAGARKDIFDQFKTDFGATNKQLTYNFRSNSRIVKLINSLVNTFDSNQEQIECARPSDSVPENSVECWIFNTRQYENEFLAQFIANELQQNPNLTPADFVILARLRVNDIENRIKEAFKDQKIKIRNEARAIGNTAIQDLVKDKIYSFLHASIKLAVNVRNNQPFQDCRDIIAQARGADLSSNKGRSETLLIVRNLINDLKELVDERNPSQISGKEITDLILEHVSRDELQRTHKEYNNDERLDSIIYGFEAFFDECRENVISWPECISNMEGTDSIRLMTIHKSKGLEYHTVIFIEFNDDAFWGNDDDVNVFFVALSRARERVYFSFTKDSKGFKNVSDFHKNLKDASVPFIEKSY